MKYTNQRFAAGLEPTFSFYKKEVAVSIAINKLKNFAGNKRSSVFRFERSNCFFAAANGFRVEQASEALFSPLNEVSLTIANANLIGTLVSSFICPSVEGQNPSFNAKNTISQVFDFCQALDALDQKFFNGYGIDRVSGSEREKRNKL